MRNKDKNCEANTKQLWDLKSQLQKNKVGIVRNKDKKSLKVQFWEIRIKIHNCDITIYEK